MRPGIEWNRSTRTFNWSPEKEQMDKNQNMEQITMQEFARMASDVLDCLNFTWDSPSCNSNNKMPVLDTQLWVGMPNRTWDIPQDIFPDQNTLPINPNDLKPVILYSFYKKEIATKTPMNSRTAVPNKTLTLSVTALRDTSK